MQPAYYEDFEEIKNKIWSMLDNAIKDRGSQFRIPVFICGNQNDFDGRIVVLRKSDRENISTAIRMNCRAVSSSVWRWPARWPRVRA